MKFADNLKKIRKRKNISQEELAEKVGVSRQSVSKWETSEAYPEMNNILELCKIFKCNINDLVNDQMVDLDSLDEEVKMSIVKLKKEKQKQMKGISKVLSLVGKITSIVLRVALGFLVLAMILVPFGFQFLDIKDGHLTTKDKKIQIVEVGKSTEIRIGDHVVAADMKAKDINTMAMAIDQFGETGVVILLELGMIFLGAFIIVLIKSLEHLELLFKNINEGDTPFTLDNVDHIKKMAYLMITCIILSSIGQTILNIPLRGQVNLELNILNIIEILFLYSMSIVFEYGHEIQLDSKGKMYDEEN
ncbi:MAG: helix-turn-helix transcriptional regulator [Bacilli bacterium]|nr:helix-turn-helix transcriptional regulator [Bacilli bacterium]